VGLTGIHPMDGDPDTVHLLAELEGRDMLTLRVHLHQFVTRPPGMMRWPRCWAAGTGAAVAGSRTGSS
jgi:hypothetical protein